MATTIVLFRNRNQLKRLLLILLAAAIIVQATILAALHLSAQPVQQPVQSLQPPPLSAEPLSVSGYQAADVEVSPAVIYLTSGCTRLSMVTTDLQTYSIRTGLDKKVDVRPTSHDVFKDLADSFGITVRMAKIEGVEGSTYFAKLYVEQGNKLLGLDSRPSDAIAIAVRFDAPVYVRDDIMATGKPIC